MIRKCEVSQRLWQYTATCRQPLIPRFPLLLLETRPVPSEGLPDFTGQINAHWPSPNAHIFRDLRLLGVWNWSRLCIAVAEEGPNRRIFSQACLPPWFVFKRFEYNECSQLIMQAAAESSTESATLIVGHNLEIDVSAPPSPRESAGLRIITNLRVRTWRN